MPGLSKQRALDELRARIETIEKHPRLAGTAEAAPDSRKLLGLPQGFVHEVFTDARRNTGAALGFALAAAHAMQTGNRPAVLLMQLIRDSQDIGVPYAAGLTGYGIDPETIVLCRPETMVELLWAVEEAIACKAVAAVIADVGHEVKILDFTATRRLSLRSSAARQLGFSHPLRPRTRSHRRPLPMAHRAHRERRGRLRSAGAWRSPHGGSISRKDDWGHARTR